MPSNCFNAKDFFAPENKYYPVYSWMWNEALDKDEIKRQIDEMYERNIRGVYVIPLPKEFRPDSMTTNLQPEYLSDGYFEMLSFAADYANEKGMTFWLYDEGGWPSGSANGLVTKGDGKLKLKLIDKNRVKKSSKPDLTNIETTEKFISLTHEKHKEKMGRSFDKVGPVVFTDEPSIGALPFTKSIRKEYKKRTGKRLSLIKLKKQKDAEFNILYHDICADVFAESYFAPIKKWCNENGLLSGGHLDKDNEPYGFRKSFHHHLRVLRYMDVPGVDVIWGQIMPEKDSGFFPRLASSASEQSGSGLSLTESLSVYGTMTYEQMRYILGYQLVRGINVLNFMLLMYDENGYYSIRQRPAFSKALPCSEFLPEFNRYMASLQYLMQNGKPDTDCALYLPMRSLWADDEDTDTALKNYENMGREIERNHSQFDIVDDDFLLNCDNENLENGRLSMGRAEYKVLYIPADKYMPDEVKKRLEKFKNGGGKIYCKDNAEFFKTLEITGDCGQLRIHKRKYNNGDVYLIFNESAEKVNAEISFTEETIELDALNSKTYQVSNSYCFESGEIKAFITLKNDISAPKVFTKGKEICALTEFEIKRIKQFTLSRNGMNYSGISDAEVPTEYGDWSLLYGKDFSGKCQYKTRFYSAGEPKDIVLSLGKVCYSCEVILNGVKIADLFMPPYETVVDKKLLKKENELIIAVSNTASNALTCFELPADWEKKHIGPYHERALEFEKKLLESGLFGPVKIYEAL